MGESVDFLAYLNKRMQLSEADLRTYSPLVLAYIGDAVYDLVIRTMLVEQGSCAVRKLHNRASALVKAQTQSGMMDTLLPLLSAEEEAVYRRGKNAKPYSHAKNASLEDYLRATGFEALMGYLYLKKETARMIDLIQAALAGLPEMPGPRNRGAEKSDPAQ